MPLSIWLKRVQKSLARAGFYTHDAVQLPLRLLVFQPSHSSVETRCCGRSTRVEQDAWTTSSGSFTHPAINSAVAMEPRPADDSESFEDALKWLIEERLLHESSLREHRYTRISQRGMRSDRRATKGHERRCNSSGTVLAVAFSSCIGRVRDHRRRAVNKGCPQMFRAERTSSHRGARG